MEHLTTILGAGMALALLCMIGLALFRQIRDGIKKKAASPDDTPQQQVTPQRECIHATVLKPYCYLTSTGTKAFHTNKAFAVRVQDDRGNIRDITVPEALYDAFEEGTSGTLTLLGGELYEFVPDHPF